MMFNNDKPYNDLPLLPPSPEKWETIEIYKQLAKARAALAELKGRTPAIPNPKMLINTLVLEEAKDSSSIENIFTSTDKLYKEDIDPLIKMAILHYQFEAIHPFTDGNGRTGHVLNVLFISLQKLLDQPILYLSKYINENKNDYYRLLLEVTKKDNWPDWILYLLKAVTETAVFTLNRINVINDLFNKTLQLVKTEKPKIYSYELVELLFSQPYCKIAFLVGAGIASRNTASKYLTELKELGILKSEQSGNETLFLNIELLKLLSKG